MTHYSRRAFAEILLGAFGALLYDPPRVGATESENEDELARGLFVYQKSKEMSNVAGQNAARLLAIGKNTFDGNVMWNDIRPDSFEFSALAGWSRINQSLLPSKTHDLVLDSQVAHFIAAGLQTLGLIISPLFPRIAVPIGIGGIWAEDGLKALFSDKTSPTVTSLPPVDSGYRNSVFQSAVNSLTDPQLTPSIRNLVRGAGIAAPDRDQLQANSEKLLGSLPPDLRDVVSKIFNDHSAASASTSEQIFKALTDRTERINVVIQDVLKRAKDAEVQHRLADYIREADGAVDVGGLLLRPLIGSEGATKFAGTAHNLVLAYGLIQQFSAGMIGGFTLAGGLIGIAFALKGLFDSNQNSELSNQLKEIDAKLDAIHGLALVISAKEDEIIRELATVYGFLVETRQELRKDLADIREDLLALKADTEADQRSAEAVKFRAYVSACLQKLRQPVRDQAWFNQVGDLANQIKDYGTSVAKQRIFNHSVGADILSLILSSRRSDLFFGWIPQALGTIRYPFTEEFRPVNEQYALPNPLVWAQSCRAYLAIQALIEEKLPGQTEHLQELWIEGLRIRQAVSAITSDDYLFKLGIHRFLAVGEIELVKIQGIAVQTQIRIAQWDDDVKVNTGVLASCQSVFADFWRQHNLCRSFLVTEVTKPRLEPDFVPGDFWAANDAIRYPEYVVTHIDPDPLQICLDRQLLDLKSEGPRNSYVIYGPKHPNAGQNVKSDRLVNLPTWGSEEILLKAGVPKGWVFTFNNSWQLYKFLNFCVALIRQSDVKIFREEFPLYFASRISELESSREFRRFKEVNAAVWLAGGINSWRGLSNEAEACMSASEDDPERVPLGVFGPVDGIFTIDGLKQAVIDIVAKMPSWSDAITPENALADLGKVDALSVKNLFINPKKYLLEALFQALNQIKGDISKDSQAPLDRSLHVVDRTLNELAGMMLLSKIPIPYVNANA
jgi:hypothetical protein